MNQLRHWKLTAAALLVLMSSACVKAQDKPPGHPPNLWLASAAEVKGKVVVQIYRAKPQASRPKERLVADTIVWDKLRQVTLGETVAAYDTSGKPLGAKEVLRALNMPRGAAVFVRVHTRLDPEQPPAFYLDMLNMNMVVLVVDGGDVYDLRP